jgi:hypothetical protein
VGCVVGKAAGTNTLGCVSVVVDDVVMLTDTGELLAGVGVLGMLVVLVGVFMLSEVVLSGEDDTEGVFPCVVDGLVALPLVIDIVLVTVVPTLWVEGQAELDVKFAEYAVTCIVVVIVVGRPVVQFVQSDKPEQL